MASLQVDAQDLLRLLESQDLDVVTEIEDLIKENLQQSRESWLLNGLVDSYMVSQSKRCMQILATVQEPHDKHLMDRIVEHIKGTVKGTPTNRLSALTLFAYIVRKQPSWLYQVARHSLMTTITKTLKTDNDVPVLMCGVLIIASITPVIPVAITQHLHDIFEAFSRLVAFNVKKPGNVPDVYLLHLQVGVYALFHRLWGMYPCNFLTYLRSVYSKPENRQVFEDLIKPMLERVRMHPLLVTASKDKELSMERWRHKEVHDIMVECAKMSLDPIEGWSEESLGPVPSQVARIPPVVPEMGALPPQLSTERGSVAVGLMPVAEAVTEPLPPALAAQDPLWSPSSVCGLSTPPPVTPGGTPSTVPVTTEFPQLTAGPLTPLPCLAAHVDSPLPHDDQTERRRLALLNTHLAVQMQQTNGETSSSSTHYQVSVPPSPLKPDFTSEPPFQVQSMRAIRKINFDGGLSEPPTQVSGPRHLGSIMRQRSDEKTQDVTPAEEAVEDISTAIAERVKAEAAQKPASEVAEMVSPSIVDDKPHVPASSSVPSVLQLPQFIDSLNVGGQASQDKLEDIDQEVSALTQTEIEEEDDSNSESDIGIPSHLPANVQMTAESVAAFMRQVNRIRFNSMNVTQEKASNKDKQYSRSNSCPNLKEPELDEATEDLHKDDDEQSPEVKPNAVQSEGSIQTRSTAGNAPPAEVVVTQVTKVTTTIQTQTSIMSTGSESETKVTNAAGAKQPETPAQQETEAERFYRYLMGILLPQPGFCEKCGTREEASTTTGEEPRRNTQLGITGRWINTARTAAPVPSPGGVPIYTTMSPPEMLDRHIMLGSDIHAQGQARIPLTSQNDVSWTHFGGVPPADEVNILSGQLLLLHTQLMFERHKSELHAKRNRRLLGRTVKTAALEEQYAAMQDQLRLQENEIQNLSESLRLQQQVVGELRAANDKHTCDRQVLQKSHSEEVENLRQSKEVLQSELRAQKEENTQLCKDMKHVRALMFCLEQELEVVNSKVAHTDELQSEVTRLTKELLLMGELQQKYQQRLVAVTNSHNSKPETQFVLDSYKAELASVRLCLDQKNTLLDSTKARLTEAEDCIKQKELMLNEDKKLMDLLRAQHKGEIQALEEKYRAQKKIQLGLHAQILNLYGQVPAATQPDDTVEPWSLEARRKSDPFATKLATQSERRLNTPEGSMEPAAVSDIPPKSPKPETTEGAASFRPHSSSAFTSYQEQKLVDSVSGQNS